MCGGACRPFDDVQLLRRLPVALYLASKLLRECGFAGGLVLMSIKINFA
jgi:hypothetical protein